MLLLNRPQAPSSKRAWGAPVTRMIFVAEGSDDGVAKLKRGAGRLQLAAGSGHYVTSIIIYLYIYQWSICHFLTCILLLYLIMILTPSQLARFHLMLEHIICRRVLFIWS